MALAAFAETFRHPDFPGLAGRAFAIVSIGLLALFAGTYFWVDTQSYRVQEALGARMPSVTVAVQGAVSSPQEITESPALASVPSSMEQPEQVAATVSETGENSVALATAPIEGLFAMDGGNILPVVRTKDGLTPFNAYSRPAAAVSGPKIAIAVLDVGLSAENSAAAIRDLPPEVSLIFSPYGDALDSLQEKARSAGHELWLSLPLESSAVPSPDPGAQAIYLNASMERNSERLLWTLGRAIGYAGVAAITPSPVMASKSQAPRLLGNVFSRGLGLADLSEKPAKTAMNEAEKADAPYVGGGYTVDSAPDRESIREKLEKAAEKAFKNKNAVVVIHPYPASLSEIQSWVKYLKDKGVSFVPLSALASPAKEDTP